MTAADGSPVDVYAALPPEPELGLVRRHAAGRPSVLDLGAGTGRIADPLAADGHEVVAVDEDAAMLSRIRRAIPVQARIAGLDLGRRFDLVLLLSHLLNVADEAERQARLVTVARHLAPGGLAMLQRLDPAHPWSEGTGTSGAVCVGLGGLDLTGWPLVRAVTTYTLEGRRWRQPWVQCVLDDADTTAALARAGLRVSSVEGAWVTAVRLDEPVTRP